jgi:hypothetical protein
MNEFTIGIPIHNKGHMVLDIIQGLKENITEDVDYIFIFDGCTDNSEAEFDRVAQGLGWNINKIKTDNIYQLKTNNLIFDTFKTENVVVFQDDMVLKDKNYLNNLRKLKNQYKNNLGIVGSRDGFEKNYSEMYGSRFSESKGRTILEPGEYREKAMINIGPIMLTRTLITKIGKFDEIYGKGAYEEMEYSLKCRNVGLINIVLGTDVLHSKHAERVVGGIQHTDTATLMHHYGRNSKIFGERWRHIAGLV